MKKKITSSIAFLFVACTPLTLSSCGAGDNGFYMANYDSYINNDLLIGLQNGSYSSLINGSEIKIDNFQYRNYATNEDLERNFETNYDIAVPTTYLAANLANQGKLEKIDWSQFGLYKMGSNGIASNELIKTSYDALSLFTPNVRAELASFNLDQAFKKDNITSKEEQAAGLLNYCVPYFVQDLILGYKTNDAINFDQSANDWNGIMNSLSNSIDANKISKVATIEDYATLYSIGRSIETNGLTANVGDAISDGDFQNKLDSWSKTENITSFENTFKLMFQNVDKKNVFYLNPDSNNILNDFANPEGSQAVISYNGDLLFAFQGGDTFSLDVSSDESIKETLPVFKEWFLNNFDYLKNEFNFNIKRPEKSQMSLDVMVLNKDRIQKLNHKKEAYAVLKKIGLEGADKSLYDSSKNSYAIDTIFSTDENDEYEYGPMLNFDYLQYSSPLLNLNAYVLNSGSTNLFKNFEQESKKNLESYKNNYWPEIDATDMDLYNSLSTNLSGNGYFTDSFSLINKQEDSVNGFLDEVSYTNYIDSLTSLYNIPEIVSPNFLGRSMSDLNKSNMYYAFSHVKYKYL